MSSLSQRYGAGLPRVGSRKLEPEEHALVRRRLRRADLEAMALVLASTSAALTGVGMVPLLDPDVAETIGRELGSAIACIGLFGTVLAAFAARGWWRRIAVAGLVYATLVATLDRLAPHVLLPSPWIGWSVLAVMVGLGHAYLVRSLHARIRGVLRRRAIAADLAHGIVEHYVGTLRPRFVDRALVRLEAAGLLDLGGALHRLELLPRSGVVLRADGRVPHALELAHVVDVAPAEPHAFRASLPEGVAPRASPPRVQLQRRSLSPAERSELALHIDRLRRPYWPALFATLATIMVVVPRMHEGMVLAELLTAPVLTWAVLFVLTAIAYARRIVAARKLAYDRELRWVVTVEDTTQPRGAPRPPKLEVLPISQLAWTENAAPAGWRISKLP